MNDLLRRVMNDFGPLAAVEGSSSAPLSGPAVKFERYTFGFQHGTLTVAAEGVDDTVRLIEGNASLAFRKSLNEVEPWAQVIGRRPVWFWLLRNHNDFLDGFQVQFGPLAATMTLQLVCEASDLSAAMVRELAGEVSAG